MSERILVTGSRMWTDRASIADALSMLKPAVVIHGAATGADRIAQRWAQDNLVGDSPWPADWSIGRRAGILRNAEMLAGSKPDRGLAFGPLWKSDGYAPKWKRTGTGDMVKRMLDVGLRVRWVPKPGAFFFDLIAMPAPPVSP